MFKPRIVNKGRFSLENEEFYYFSTNSKNLHHGWLDFRLGNNLENCSSIGVFSKVRTYCVFKHLPLSEQIWRYPCFSYGIMQHRQGVKLSELIFFSDRKKACKSLNKMDT